jgi:hypothetical protein
MCGPQTPRPSQALGGALAVLSAPLTSTHAPFSGQLVFHAAPGAAGDSSLATHATFTPSSSAELGHLHNSLDGCVVGIHATGDLRAAHRSEDAMLHRLDFRQAYPSLTRTRSTQILLEEPLEIAVGGQGIIGRKISVWWDKGDGEGVTVAEGIVGFN